MKKVMVITFHSVPNYGAVLQAYALCNVLRQIGFDVHLIDYQPKSISKGDSDSPLHKKFADFRKKHLPLTPQVFTNLNQLNGVDADVLVCGSDQIWNFAKSKARKNMDAFLLNFGPDSAIRISYAASTGGVGFPKEYHDKISECLASFQNISVRERTSLKDVGEVTDKSIDITVDPTVLCDDYPEADITCYELPEKYIVTYCLQASPVFLDAVHRVKTLYNLPVVNIGDTAAGLADKSLTSLGPDEWICLLRQSECVVTNSFHGTVFSIKVKKNFLSVPLLRKKKNKIYGLQEKLYRKGYRKAWCLPGNSIMRNRLFANWSSKNDRISSFLRLSGLNSRLYDYPDSIDFVGRPIDYDNVMQKIKYEKDESIRFLHKVLKGN
ncbi:Polysaccharide pyruvyl transferase [Anaerohalosphaera lusitana]|uniref:Polysaccharide pyruvyl transferase n=1 Tax=Anaerohalosphaera lusitana TaxID=1936003 RepID=A0A1U9NLE2_9BACT|nr:polysaccharide pyruvyl transferase family protein [Anaerohalosphaera lusitana]AQT68645.1 Polysaccharide pyruvyl transferase [Anaerohalosphaera lusitana]